MNSQAKKKEVGFDSAGREIDKIDVRISHRIIQLFSEGLYSSPNKAIEELVSNSFDADARNVHVILSPDLTAPNATIAVIDDGEGMDVDALKVHWIIGRSSRRTEGNNSKRMPIGKFGIGKLATFVLSEKLTHICKVDSKYVAATMNYSILGPSPDGFTDPGQEGIFNDNKIIIPIRTLSESEAFDLLKPWLTGSRAGYKALKLFGEGAQPSWTVAIMSSLKQMGRTIQRGKLKWILRSAMPLRDDFNLYLDGDRIEPSKIDMPIIQKWVIGKDILSDTLNKPCPDGFFLSEDESFSPDSIHRYGLSHSQLGRVTGYIELFESDISGGVSSEIERSNGFFIYVRGRMINTEDPGFGIPRNLLQHGTFSRFRMVAHIDSLDQELRSSRESLQQGDLLNLAKGFLHSAFNLARNRLVDYDKKQSPGAQLSARLSSAPGSLTRGPLITLAIRALEGNAHPRYTLLPSGIGQAARAKLTDEIKERINAPEGIIQTTELVISDSNDGLAIYDVVNSKLLINMSHPFVAAFQESYINRESRMPLEMYAMTEVLIEAHLYYFGIDENIIHDVLAIRDELLRYFVRSSIKRTAGMIAMALTDAKEDSSKLEEEMRASFEAIGFANVIRIGGSGKPDGTAEAHLAASDDGIIKRYKVGLEAKSGGVVSAHRLGVSGIARHMKEFNCDHHLVIGNGFDTNSGDGTATVKEIKNLRETSLREGSEKTITLMYIDDLSRLVRLIPAKRIDLVRLRKLFQTCITPEESKTWIDGIANEKEKTWPYKEILSTIWKIAESRPSEPVEYGMVAMALELGQPPIKISKQELIDCCKAMSILASGVVFARANTVEITRSPNLALRDIRDAIKDYPESERANILL